MEGIVVGIVGIEGMLGSGGKVALGTVVGMLGSGGSEPGLGSVGWVVGKVGIVGCGNVGIDGNGGSPVLGKGGNC